MTDRKLNDIIEMEPRSFKPRASNPLSINEIVQAVPDVSLFMNDKPTENFHASPRILNDRVPKIGQQFNETTNPGRRNEASNSSRKLARPVLPISHVNTQQQRICQASSSSDRIQPMRITSPYKPDLMNYNGNSHHQQQTYQAPHASDSIQYMRTISPYKPDSISRNGNIHHQQQHISRIPNTSDEIQHMRRISNTQELMNRNYSPDMRLKFYQKLQGFPKIASNNFPKPKHDGRPPPPKSQFPQPPFNIIGNVSQTSQLALTPSNTPSPKSKPDKSKNDKDNINKENVKHLIDLIKNQASHIQALKMQVISLIALHKEKLKTQKLLSTVRCYNEMDTTPQVVMRQNQQFTQTNPNTNYAMMENKISVGVMTSFEFTLKNKQVENNTDGVNQRLQMPSTPEDRNFMLPANVSNPTRNDVEKQIDNSNEIINQNIFFNASEKQAREQLTRRINLEHNAAVSSFNIQDKYYLAEENNEMFQSTVQPKIGWTFYNNILCQVNEILNNSHDIRQPTQHLYNTIMKQRSTARQLKIFEAKITDLKDIVSTNISQKITATVDSSYYPKVNYPTTAIPSAESITDSNTSFHMRKLAMKYLGNKNFSESMIMNEQFVSKVLIDNDLAHNNNLSMRAACNYAEKYALTSDQNHLVNIDGRKNYHQNNILDISVLKQQPKLL